MVTRPAISVVDSTPLIASIIVRVIQDVPPDVTSVLRSSVNAMILSQVRIFKLVDNTLKRSILLA